MLTREEEETLKPWTRRPKTVQALARRARPVLAGAQGKSHAAVAAEVGGVRLPGAHGGPALLRAGWTACSMSRGPAPPAASASLP